MNSAHFFDIDLILIDNAKVWVVDKTIPNIPIMKITQSDFNLIKSGIWRSQNNSITFSGETYWLSDDIYNKLKIKSKKSRSDISNLAFSMQEFLNKEIIESSKYDINIDNIAHLKNTKDDIYIICSRNKKSNYEKVISQIEEKLKNNGINIKKYYFISETFYNRDSDDISNKKVRLILQHLIGLRTDIDKFTDTLISKYNTIFYYDDDQATIQLAINSNKVMSFLLSNTSTDTKDIIKKQLKNEEHKVMVNYYTGNKISKYIETIVDVEFSNLNKMFESFKRK